MGIVGRRDVDFVIVSLGQLGHCSSWIADFFDEAVRLGTLMKEALLFFFMDAMTVDITLITNKVEYIRIVSKINKI